MKNKQIHGKYGIEIFLKAQHMRNRSEKKEAYKSA